MINERHVRRPAERSGLSVVLAVLTASCWWAWMAWDQGYQTDPATGAASGPYQAWQVVGCVVCLVALGVGASVRLPAWLVVPIMPVAFTAAWTWTAAGADDSGLWAVGAVLVFAGMLVGTGVVSGITAFARGAAGRRGRAVPAG
ncbi:hypothetical protein GCM10027271_08840 [Saccharopolyspora gloriosae]|uniref:Uncharacterized protein n=1 Tax=Saccharopolyspora gloriosae TaxID=455344 RepID=A0A840NMV8_9PSEU|nr:hypothetical protein [Saccharopolyspora gloriosae]MBB5072431.1 hypothetical protein [Saccharopolyspora gloriosae]